MTPATAEKDEDQVAGEIGEEERVDRSEKPTSVNLREDDLPLPLQEVAKDLDFALNDAPPPIELAEGVRYKRATDAKRVAKVLIRDLHEALEGFEFRVWYRPSLRHGGRVVNGVTSTPPGRWRQATGLDFYIDINLPRWQEMSAAERIRLIDHELCHLEADEDSVTTGAHEIEEYSSILRRWGPTSSQRDFVKTANQLDLGV